MKKNIVFYFLVVSICLGFITTDGFADDLYLNSALETGTYQSTGNIIAQSTCVINTGINATFQANLDVILEPGFEVKPGGILTVNLVDVDGLSNYCEMQYFGHLNYGPDDDSDGDQITNVQECSLNLNPNDYDIDNDDDDLPDWWEIEYFGLDLSNDRNQDSDGDGVTNYLEYKLGSNPSVNDLPGPGIHYEYDELGRIKKIYRIPAQ